MLLYAWGLNFYQLHIQGRIAALIGILLTAACLMYCTGMDLCDKQDFAWCGISGNGPVMHPLRRDDSLAERARNPMMLLTMTANLDRISRKPAPAEEHVPQTKHYYAKWALGLLKSSRL